MTFVEMANRLEAEQGTIVDHFHATKYVHAPHQDAKPVETIIFRSTSSEGYTRYITIDGWEPQTNEFDTYYWHTFHGHQHEPLWTRAMKDTQVDVLPEQEHWFVRLMKRMVGW